MGPNMSISKRKETATLFFGDIVLLYASLWIALAVRYSTLPSREIFNLHFAPFSIIILVWLVIFFISGLYEKHTLILKSRLPSPQI
jgi:FlaA1/EpsC-like NDP-sugar epimerase